MNALFGEIRIPSGPVALHDCSIRADPEARGAQMMTARMAPEDVPLVQEASDGIHLVVLSSVGTVDTKTGSKLPAQMWTLQAHYRNERGDGVHRFTVIPNSLKKA